MDKLNYQPEEGDIVLYKESLFWVAELRNNSRVRLLPLDAIDFDDGLVFDMSKSIEVDVTRIKLAKHNLR